MSVLVSQNEAQFFGYPNVASAALWKRIENYIAWRWGEREVTWIVNGPGEWLPPLIPYTVTSIEVWRDDWEPVTLDPVPIGLCLDELTYRVKATVGSTDAPPADVLEAATRLSEYFADGWDAARAATTFRSSLGELDSSAERPATWAARALQYSGAADLLRNYRNP